MRKQLILFVLVPVFLTTVLNGCINEPENGIDGSSGNGGSGFTSPGKIAFQTGGSIHLINPDGTNEIRLGEGQGPILWSKDGKRLCYYSYYSSLDLINGELPNELIIANTNGKEISRIPLSDLNLSILDWHPDGNKFLCEVSHNATYVWQRDNGVSTGVFKQYVLCSVDIHSNDVTELGLVNNLSSVSQFFKYSYSDAIYSPDGKITYSKGDGLYICDSNGKNSHRLINIGGIILLGWSSDGSLLLSFIGGKLYIIDRNNGNKILLDDRVDLSAGYDVYFSEWPHFRSSGWSPDSKKIAYWSVDHEGDKYNLYISNPDGTGKIKITTAETDEISSPSWSPDGKRIVYSVEDSIYIANADDSNIKYFHTGSYPKWSPK
ncbi:PD40 domain-containing protein [bacterium]|nr:PD40 domain-containing protein [bacterium]